MIDNKRLLMIGGAFVAIIIVIIISLVSCGSNQSGSALQPGTTTGVNSNSESEGSGSNPLAPAPDPTTGGNPEDVYPDGDVPDWVDPVREGEDLGHEDGDSGDFSDDENTLPPGTFGDWTPTAEGFGRAFADTSVGKDNWLLAMRPYITNSLYDTLSQGDPSATKLNYLGVAMIEDNGGGRVDAVANYGVASLTMTLIQTGDAWYVDTVGYQR